MVDHVAARPRVGLVGVGAISDWHVRALRHAGLDVTAVAARAGSPRLRDFAARHGIATIFPRWEDLLEARRTWEGLLIATHTDVTPAVLDAALPLAVPTLVEKPVAWMSARIAELSARAHPRVMVGFNRRFYRSVNFVRDEALAGPPLLAHLALPEAVDVQAAPKGGRPYWELFFANSCHGLDLLRFVFGPLHVGHVERMRGKNGNVQGLAATLSSVRGDVIQVTGNWGAPANFALSLDRAGRRVELRPFELATVYESMDVLEPSEEVPVRRYTPRVKDRVMLDDVDRQEKPGFVRQAEAFRAMVEGRAQSSLAATLDDAAAALRLAEDLLGEHWPERA